MRQISPYKDGCEILYRVESATSRSHSQLCDPAAPCSPVAGVGAVRHVGPAAAAACAPSRLEPAAAGGRRARPARTLIFIHANGPRAISNVRGRSIVALYVTEF
ncbi:hypothetical protein EVAR_91535_1 [Eumeta japonica]|uniref:Uncharacterized protein n=1 Tax=Eumeta variegata TaxID=151549 RepID=A0A4C1VBH7_EUMVA|nr:hypothetical protein EVAR_91535_1 [Eumeta japonica]